MQLLIPAWDGTEVFTYTGYITIPVSYIASNTQVKYVGIDCKWTTLIREIDVAGADKKFNEYMNKNLA